MTYDKFYAFTFFVGGTVSTFLDILFPNKYCSTFLEYCIKRLSFTLEQNGESSDSNGVHAEVRAGESRARDVAEESPSESSDHGYDQVSPAQSNKSEPDGDCVSVKGDDELGPRPLCT
jgi:hypothetical protein